MISNSIQQRLYATAQVVTCKFWCQCSSHQFDLQQLCYINRVAPYCLTDEWQLINNKLVTTCWKASDINIHNDKLMLWCHSADQASLNNSLLAVITFLTCCCTVYF